MAHTFPSPEWVAAYGDAINASEGYRKAGREWTHGVVAMVVKADVALGIAEDMAMLLDVHEGQCRSARLVGQRARLETAIADGRGSLRIGDTLWQVTGPDLPAGTNVRISASDGIVLTVEPAPR